MEKCNNYNEWKRIKGREKLIPHHTKYLHLKNGDLVQEVGLTDQSSEDGVWGRYIINHHSKKRNDPLNRKTRL